MTTESNEPAEPAERWHVIVVRAWRDGDQVRARILVDSPARRSWVAASLAEAVDRVRLLLGELQDERDDAKTERTTPG